MPARADVVCNRCDGTGWILGRRKRHWRDVKMFYVSYRHVNGVRGPLRWVGPLTHAEAEQKFEALSREYCEVAMAKGRSRSDGFDAMPTGSTVREGSGGGDELSTYRAAVTGGRLDRMRAKWPLSADVMDSWYGEDGGVLAALWPYTPPGKTLLRRNQQKLPPVQYFINERADAEAKQDRQRLALFDKADEQARELLVAVKTLWNLVVEERARMSGAGS
jgi:hypothetical protein